MLSRSTPASSMQKTYDDCYLICSTAVYFEKQNNEEEAVRSWRSALDAIYYHNAYRIPANYKPKSETEKALQDSLRDMELQCKERVDLLDALRKSREDAKEQDANGSHPVATPTSVFAPSASASSHAGPDQGNTPAINYPDLARPTLPKRPGLQVRQPSSSSLSNTLAPESPRTKSSSSMPFKRGKSPAPATDASTTRQARTPSPEKKHGLLRSTLRPQSGGPAKSASGRLSAASLRPKPPANASKAATLAWPAAGPPSSRTPSTGGGYAQPNHARPAAGIPPNEPLSPAKLSGMASVDLNGPPSPRPIMQKLRPKKPRSSNVGAQASPDPSPGGTPPPPPPPPHRDPIGKILANDGASTTNGLGSPIPPPEFPAYRREYSATTTPTIDSKQAQMMAANLHGNLSTLSAVPDSPRRRKSPERKKPPPPPVPRKAIGSPRGSKSFMTHGRRPSDLVSSSSEADNLTARDSAATDEDAEILADFEGGEAKAKDAAWDARVKQLMQNLPKGVDEQAAKAIFNEVVIKGDEVHWDDVAGLDIAKGALKEAVVYPFLRPDLFRGLREPARGMLLFGPPGTGKTMLARAVATESKSTFFAISASSLTSKYLGESEKLVRALFAIAKVLTPSIIFVDEIDSLLSVRSGSGEHEATRRIKTEFLIQWSDLAKAAAGRDDKDKIGGDASRVLVLAATNLPWAIDEAARRRFVRRQYIPLPESEVRASQLRRLLSAQTHSLDDADLMALVELTDGYSGSDITALAKDAAMGPLRSLGEKLLDMSPEDIKPISMDDFASSLVNIRPSVSKSGLKEYEDWARQFGERGG